MPIGRWWCASSVWGGRQQARGRSPLARGTPTSRWERGGQGRAPTPARRRRRADEQKRHEQRYGGWSCGDVWGSDSYGGALRTHAAAASARPCHGATAATLPCFSSKRADERARRRAVRPTRRRRLTRAGASIALCVVWRLLVGTAGGRGRASCGKQRAAPSGSGGMTRESLPFCRRAGWGGGQMKCPQRAGACQAWPCARGKALDGTWCVVSHGCVLAVWPCRGKQELVCVLWGEVARVKHVTGNGGGGGA
jgi:hypothetical protein